MIVPTPSILAAQEPPPRWEIRRPVLSLTRLSHKLLRIVTITFTFVVFLLSIIFAGKRLTSVSDDGTTSGMKALGVIVGLIYLLFAVVAFGGVAAAFKDDARLFRIYSYASLANVGLIGLAGILDVVSHFAFKASITSQCRSNSTGKEFTPEGESKKVIYTEEEAINYCNDLYKKSNWGAPVWMLLAIVLASITSLFALAYAHKLANLRSSSFPTDDVLQSDNNQDHALRPYQSSQYSGGEAPKYPAPSSIKPSDGPSSNNYIEAQEDAWNEATLSSAEQQERKQHRVDATRGPVGTNKADGKDWEQV